MADLVPLHPGVLPALKLAAQTGVPTRWNAPLRCLEPDTMVKTDRRRPSL